MCVRACAPTYHPAVLPRLCERALVHDRLKVVAPLIELDRGGGAHGVRPERFAACEVGQERGSDRVVLLRVSTVGRPRATDLVEDRDTEPPAAASRSPPSATLR